MNTTDANTVAAPAGVSAALSAKSSKLIYGNNNLRTICDTPASNKDIPIEYQTTALELSGIRIIPATASIGRSLRLSLLMWCSTDLGGCMLMYKFS